MRSRSWPPTSPNEREDLDALERYQVALARFTELVRLTGDEIAKERGVPTDSGHHPDRKLDYWENRPAPDGWTHANFEWHIRRDDAREDPCGVRVIGAGVSWPRGLEPSDDVLRAWRTKLASHGFELGHGPDATYLFRYRPLTEGIEVGGLRDQACDLASGVLDAWRALENHSG